MVTLAALELNGWNLECSTLSVYRSCSTLSVYNFTLMAISIVIDCSVVICKQLCFLVSLHYKHFHVLILCWLEASVQGVHDFLKSGRKPPAHFEISTRSARRNPFTRYPNIHETLNMKYGLNIPLPFVTHFIFVRFFYQN